MTSISADHFRANYLGWLAVSHLLPAQLFRELCRIFVLEVSRGAVPLETLFEEILLENGDLSSWVVRPIEVTPPLSRYLQHCIRSLVWQHDAENYPPDDVTTEDDLVSPADVEAAIMLGKQDLSVSSAALQRLQPAKRFSIAALFSGIERLAHGPNGVPFQSDVDEILAGVKMPLRAAFMKHLGDLCADDDRWQDALTLYDGTLALWSEVDLLNWAEMATDFRNITLQSRASALRTISGPAAAAAILQQPLATKALAEAPIFILNASHDAMVSELLSGPTLRFVSDRRASLLKPPLLLDSHDFSTALSNMSEGKFDQAQQHFWAVLRRQLALGSASEARSTKAQYGRCIIEAASSQPETKRNSDVFWLGVRLLIESGLRDQVTKIDWKEFLVRSFVDTRLINRAIDHANRYKGSRPERTAVLIECLAAWVGQLSSEQSEAARSAIEALVENIQENHSSHSGSQTVGDRSLEALLGVFAKRPEFRAIAASMVAPVICAALKESRHWKAKSDAIKLTQIFLGAFAEADLESVAEALLDELDKLDPSKEVWPIVQPSMDLLSRSELNKLSTRYPALGRRIVAAILHFGLNQKSEHAHLLFFLEDFDAPLLSDRSVEGQVCSVVDYVKAEADQTNASNTLYNVNALLYGSKLSGRDGVLVALNSFLRVLNSAKSERPSIGLAFGYETLILLSQRRDRIEAETSIDSSLLVAKFDEILNCLKTLWSVAKKKPVVFAPFSFPPAIRPDPTYVHNWAYASLQFAASLGELESIQGVLRDAEEQELLREPINMGRARYTAGSGTESYDFATIVAETAEAFYAVLSKVLAKK